MFKIGEALVGTGNEVAHIDLMIGDKEGPIGTAFANGLVQLSRGHTPILGVIRPNLPPKPHVLIVPKVTVEGGEDVTRIFGPAQAAVSKGIADALEEGIIPREKLDDWVIIASVFVHPQAKDFRRIYHFNYSAAKLALGRALSDYPGFDKVVYEKDRAVHPIMGFKVPRLWDPPYLQVALDTASVEQAKKVVEKLPKSDRILLEVGTPLIKAEGLKAVSELRKVAKNRFILADLKTMDVGQVEVDMAFNETADAVTVAGAAPVETINKFIYEAKRMGVYSVLDTINVHDPVKLLKSLKELPDVVEIHRGIDTEGTRKSAWDHIQKIKSDFKDKKLLIAVAGGIKPGTAGEALEKGADIIVVGRYISQAKDVTHTCREFLRLLGQDADQLRVHIE